MTTFILLGTSLGDPLTLTVPDDRVVLTLSALQNLGFVVTE